MATTKATTLAHGQAGAIVSGTLATARIADDAVTLAKMASGTDGQIITYDASGNPAVVGPGTDGQVLTSTGAGSPPAFEAAGGGNTVKLHQFAQSADANVNGNATGYYFTFDVTPTSSSSKLSAYHSMYYSQTDAGSTTVRAIYQIQGSDLTNIERATSEQIARVNGKEIYWTYWTEQITVSGTSAVTFNFGAMSDHANNVMLIYGCNILGAESHATVVEIY